MRLTTLAFLALAACEEPAPSTDDVADNCGAAGYQNLIGQPANVFASMTLPSPMRIIKSGMLFTQEYVPKRLNVDLDRNNRITRFWCG